MLTLIIMLIQSQPTANILSIILAASWIVYAILFLIVKANRKPKQIKSALTTAAVVTLVFDIVWFFNFFDNFEYVNPGLKGMLWVFGLPAVMLILVMALSYINVNVDTHEKKKLEKEMEKERKKESRRQKYDQDTEKDKESENK